MLVLLNSLFYLWLNYKGLLGKRVSLNGKIQCDTIWDGSSSLPHASKQLNFINRKPKKNVFYKSKTANHSFFFVC